MGLGKTVQAMALILANPPEDLKPKTTLIVAPLALLRQWKQEILTKIKPRYSLDTLVYHGSNKNVTISEILEYDVVLCTYAGLQHEFKNKYEEHRPLKVKLLANKTHFHRVILDEAHNIRNQNTKCSKAAAEIKATYRLCMTGTPFMNRAEEIFPLIRFLGIQPYNEWERFSEDIVRPLKKWDGDGKDQAMVKLQALFRSFTLRRTKDSMLDGRPIIELPPRTDQPSYVEFNEQQRQFYQALEVQQQLQFNEYLLNGAVMKHYIHILILLLRLRQACDHPFLLKNLGIPEGAKLDDKQMVKLACKLPAEVLRGLKQQKIFKCPLCPEMTENPVIVVPCGHHVCPGCFTLSMTFMEMENLTADRDDDVACPREKTRVPCPGSNCQHFITATNIVCYNLLSDVPDSAFESDNDDDDNRRSRFRRDSSHKDVGGRAYFPPSGVGARGELLRSAESENYSDLGSIFVDDDDEEYGVDDEDEQGGANEERGANDEHGRATEEHGDDGTGAAAGAGDFGAFQTDGAFDDIRNNYGPRKHKRKSSSTARDGRNGNKKSRNAKEHGSSADNRKGKDRKSKKKVVTMADQRQAAQRSAIAMSRYKERLRREWISSAKIDAIMEILGRIRRTGEKTLVFSLWTSFLDLVEIPVERAGVRFTRYDGSMTPGARDAAVSSFMEDPGVEVMLVSLTAGNAGLNLTAASQVIVTEPFWNPFVEEQAIDRAHRFGQKRPVVVHRLLVSGTVEDRIVALQERKKMLVDAALSEKGAANVSRLNVNELRDLFGL
jgi:SNF2 family DNA or RNA helicase